MNQNKSMKDKNSQQQLDIFNKNDEIIKDLKTISLNELTPIEALNRLNLIKQKLD